LAIIALTGALVTDNSEADETGAEYPCANGEFAQCAKNFLDSAWQAVWNPSEDNLHLFALFSVHVAARLQSSPIGGALSTLFLMLSGIIFAVPGNIMSAEERRKAKVYRRDWDELTEAEQTQILQRPDLHLAKRFQRNPAISMLSRFTLVHYIPMGVFFRVALAHLPSNSPVEWISWGFLLLHYIAYLCAITSCLVMIVFKTCYLKMHNPSQAHSRDMCELHAYFVLPLHVRVPEDWSPDLQYRQELASAWDEAPNMNIFHEFFTVLCLVFCSEPIAVAWFLTFPGSFRESMKEFDNACGSKCRKFIWFLPLMLAAFTFVVALMTSSMEKMLESWTFAWFVHSVMNAIGLLLALCIPAGDALRM